MHLVYLCHVIQYLCQANAIGRSAKPVREFLEKHYSEDQVATERGTIKLALKALLEVVQSGSKNMEVAVMRRREPLRVWKLCLVPFICHKKVDHAPVWSVGGVLISLSVAVSP